ncbi:Uncharacterised protein [Mycobacterium tuberculosis]|nr:Uncharacterised protein [Mycobacterium tuberculosis]
MPSACRLDPVPELTQVVDITSQRAITHFEAIAEFRTAPFPSNLKEGEEGEGAPGGPSHAIILISYPDILWPFTSGG